MTSVRAKLLDQMQARRDAKAEKAMELLREVAAAEMNEGDAPTVGQIVTLLVELGISDMDIDRYVEVNVQIREAQQTLETTSDQNANHRDVRRREAELKAGMAEQLERYKASLREIQKEKRRLESLDTDRREAERKVTRLRTELAQMERRFRNLPDEPEVRYRPEMPIVDATARILHRLKERAASQDAASSETSVDD